MKHILLLSLLFLPSLFFAQKGNGVYDGYFEAIKKGNYKKAKKELLKLSTSENDRYFNLLIRGHYYGNIGELDSAKYYLNSAIDFYAFRSITYEDPNFKKNRDSLYATAIGIYDMIIAKEPLCYNYSSRGGFKLEIGLLRDAISDYNKALQLDSTHGMSYFNKGLAYSRLNLLDSAIFNYNLTLKYEPNNASCYLNKGFVYLKKNEFDTAISEFKKGLDKAEGVKEASFMLNNIGYCYYKKAEYEQSEHFINESIKINPVNPYAYRNLALLEIATSKSKEACLHLDEAIKLGFTDQYGNEVLQLKELHCK